MGHIVADKGWATIDIDTATGAILVREDWHYNWSTWPTAKPWTRREKLWFHGMVDKMIWSVWSSGVHLDVYGSPPWRARRVPVTFDVRWKLSGHRHWEVMAYKVPPGSQPTFPVRSFVYRNVNIIDLSSADVRPRLGVNEAGGSFPRHPVIAHEFGHTMQWWDDEYEARSRYVGDTKSIMNVGRVVRERHLISLVIALNTMIPGVAFSVSP